MDWVEKGTVFFVDFLMTQKKLAMFPYVVRLCVLHDRLLIS